MKKNCMIYKKEYQKQYYQLNKEELSKSSKKRYEKNKIYNKEKKKKYYQSHKLERKKYLEINKEKIKEQRKIYYKNRRKIDINFKLAGNLRNRINQAIRCNYKNTSARVLLNCTILQLKQYLEKQFTKKMDWFNYGKYWEIDHIKPCFCFDLSKKAEQFECFNYNNLRPLTIKQNRSRDKK